MTNRATVLLASVYNVVIHSQHDSKLSSATAQPTSEGAGRLSTERRMTNAALRNEEHTVNVIPHMCETSKMDALVRHHPDDSMIESVY